MESIFAAAIGVVRESSTEQKAIRARNVAYQWREGKYALSHAAETPPDTPGRPPRPELVPPRLLPRRRLGSQAGRAALLHAIAHIELNAIDLAADMIARFGPHSDISETDRGAFISDWISVLDDEARHFQMLTKRLGELSAEYGDYPAHNGLWDAARATRDDISARLAIAPLVLEARGLDVTPQMIEKLRRAGDEDSAGVLNVIYTEEIGHVAIGARWFSYICDMRGLDPQSHFQDMVDTHFSGGLKRPFNVAARSKAGLPRAFYDPQ